jgi:hypothetical protein
MKTYDLPNYRQFKITFLGPTNHRGARVKITEHKESVILPYDYSIGDIEQQGLNYLTERGFKAVCRTQDKNSCSILCDNWGSDFIDLKNI